ncbi:phosphatase PAP2 family protein [Pseudomonas sp. NPDC090203]|uniref:phosphatase PAP2 family protein n=1 Tax=Pseudomonas sp. NPDC090203 TaxID=3364477 RepID=UPI00380A6C25
MNPSFNHPTDDPTVSDSKTRFYLNHAGAPLLLALLLFVSFDLTGLDVILSDWMYNTTTHAFPLQHSKLFETITHKWARIIPNWTGEAAVVGAVLSFIWPLLKAEKHPRLLAWLEKTRIGPVLRFLSRHRRDLLFVVFAFSLTTGAIHYFKSHTSIYCPVETTLYGGTEQKKEWFENINLLHDAGKGRCWPGGHASGGFTMMALFFVARRYRWRHARKLLAFSLALGMVYGTTRVLQGWHFMSHTFWAGIIVWFSMFLTAMAFYGRRRLDPAIQPSPADTASSAFKPAACPVPQAQP